MEEAVWQGATLIFPQPEGAQPRVDRAHADLAQRHGSPAISTRSAGQIGKAGRRHHARAQPRRAAGRAELTLCENIGALLGPLLERQTHAWTGRGPLKIVLLCGKPRHRCSGRATSRVKVGVGSALVGAGRLRHSSPATTG